MNYKLTILGKKKKNKLCFKKESVFSTILRFEVKSTEKRLYLIYKYKKQTFANLPNSGVYTKVYSAYIQVTCYFTKKTQLNEIKHFRIF